MADRGDAGARGHGGAGPKLVLVLVLSASYAAIGWIGPGNDNKFESFYADYPALLAILAATTAIALAAGTALGIRALSGAASRKTRLPKGRDIDSPTPPPRSTTPRPARALPARARFAARASSTRNLLRRELPGGAVAAYVVLAAHAAFVLAGALPQPPPAGAVVAHAICVAAPVAAWGVIVLSDYVHGLPPAAEEAGTGDPKARAERRSSALKSLAARAVAGALVLGALASHPQLVPLLPAHLAVWGLDLAWQAVLLRKLGGANLASDPSRP